MLTSGLHCTTAPLPHCPTATATVVSSGAEPNLRTGTARTGSALLVASQFGHLDLAELLLSYGADPNHMTIDGITALMSAALDGYLEIVQLLLGNGG